jgi:hypothetical protein
MEGEGGMVFVALKQVSELPAPTVIGGVALDSPLESLSTITTLTPAPIVTCSQVYEVPVISSAPRAAIMLPSAVSLWKEQRNGPTPVLVSYARVKGSQLVMLSGAATWNALATEARRGRTQNVANFMTGRKGRRMYLVNSIDRKLQSGCAQSSGPSDLRSYASR